MPYILGVKVDNVTRKKAIARIDQMIRDGGQHIVTTPNPEMIVAAQRDLEFREILNRSSLALPDGFGLMLAARLLRQPLAARVPGSDFVWDVAQLAAEKEHTLYLYGGKDQVAQQAAEKLKLKYPELKIVAGACGEKLTIVNFSPQRSDIETIQNAQPDILLVAFGHGKQEKWIATYLKELPSVKVAMGVGGALDFIAGRVVRAPRIFRTLGLEWIWRLFRQPWRLPRIWRAVGFFPLLVLREKLRGTIHQ